MGQKKWLTRQQNKWTFFLKATSVQTPRATRKSVSQWNSRKHRRNKEHLELVHRKEWSKMQAPTNGNIVAEDLSNLGAGLAIIMSLPVKLSILYNHRNKASLGVSVQPWPLSRNISLEHIFYLALCLFIFLLRIRTHLCFPRNWKQSLSKTLCTLTSIVWSRLIPRQG